VSRSDIQFGGDSTYIQGVRMFDEAHDGDQQAGSELLRRYSIGFIQVELAVNQVFDQ
jgi:hypothetical protein